METSGAATAGQVGWYVLGPNQESVGPYALAELREHFANGYLNESTILWAEGRTEWMPLSSIPELHSGVTTKDQPEQAAPDAEDDFEKFQKEVIQGEAEVEALKGSAEDGDVNKQDDERPATPPDGEEEFTDDDGTIYKWDRTLRAWVPQNDVSGKKEGYAVEEMPFAPEEEVFQAPDIPGPSTFEEINTLAENINKEPDKAEKRGEKKRKSSEKPAEKKKLIKLQTVGLISKSTHMSVNGLTDDVTVEQDYGGIFELWNKKEDPETKKPRVKVYTDKENGMKKGAFCSLSDSIIGWVVIPS